MFIYTTATSRSDLEGILALQKKNLPNILTPEEIRSQGFVTVMHSFIDLENLNNIENHVIARHQGVVIAYLLAMTRISGFDIPLLQPMFEMFSKVSFSDKKIAGFNYLVVGQVCVDKKFRGQGVLDSCYAYYKKEYQSKYDFAITEIDGKNQRSLHAHKRVGFKEVGRYDAPGNTEWVIVLWNWNDIDCESHQC